MHYYGETMSLYSTYGGLNLNGDISHRSSLGAGEFGMKKKLPLSMFILRPTPFNDSNRHGSVHMQYIGRTHWDIRCCPLQSLLLAVNFGQMNRDSWYISALEDGVVQAPGLPAVC
jgi:hypothetical protein